MNESGILGRLTADEIAVAAKLCPAPTPSGPGVCRVAIETQALGRVTVTLARMREPRWKRLYWSAFRADAATARKQAPDFAS